MASLIVFNVYSLLALRVSFFRVFVFSHFLRFRVFCVFAFSAFSRFLPFRVFPFSRSRVFPLSRFRRFRVFVLSRFRALCSILAFSRFRAFANVLAPVARNHFRVAIKTFVFKVLRHGLLRYILHTCPKL